MRIQRAGDECEGQRRPRQSKRKTCGLYETQSYKLDEHSMDGVMLTGGMGLGR